MIYSYNKSQQDALFLNFILVKNSTCFGQTYCPSSGVLMLYTQQLVFVTQLCWLSIPTSPAVSQHNQYDKYQLLWIQYQDFWWWTVNLSETWRVLYQNKVEKECILLASFIRIFQLSVQFSTATLQLPVRSCGSRSFQPVDTGDKLIEVWWRSEVPFLHIKRPELHPHPNKPPHGDRAYAKWDHLSYAPLFQVHLQKKGGFP